VFRDRYFLTPIQQIRSSEPWDPFTHSPNCSVSNSRWSRLHFPLSAGTRVVRQHLSWSVSVDVNNASFCIIINELSHTCNTTCIWNQGHSCAQLEVRCCIVLLYWSSRFAFPCNKICIISKMSFVNTWRWVWTLRNLSVNYRLHEFALQHWQVTLKFRSNIINYVMWNSHGFQPYPTTASYHEAFKLCFAKIE
jgi:hypothetical protein